MEHLFEIGSPTTCPVIMFIRNGQVMTGLRHYYKGMDKEFSVWTIPGGRCEAGETIEQTLRREVAEEVGINDFEISEFLGIIPGSYKNDVVYVFAGATDKNPTLMEPEKFSQWGWRSLDDLPSNLNGPKTFELAREYWNKIKPA